MALDSDSISHDTPLRWSESAISTEIDGELVALDVTKGVCYGLNKVGTRIWQALETPRSARQIAEILIEEFDVEPEVCLEQTLELLRELSDADLIH